MERLNRLISSTDEGDLLEALQNPILGLRNVRPENTHVYSLLLAQVQAAKGSVSCSLP